MTRAHRTVVIALAALIAVAATSWAQPPHVHLQRFEVAIWPEYDQPAALVMYRGWLAPDVELPITVSLPLPSQVTTPSAVAKRGPGTGLLVATHTIESNGDWNMIHLQTDLPEIRVEFYLDLATDLPGRAFTFEWPGGPVIDEAFYEVMQPLGASNFAATPSSAPPAVGQDGLMYQREELGPIAEGAPFYVQVSYNKNSPDLTASALRPAAPPAQTSPPPQTVAPAPQQQPAASAESSNDSIWIVVLPIVFAAGLAAGWILLKTGKEKDS
jgi:hypothetical protein